VVTAFFDRLGNLGLLLIASALLVGGLAGAAVTHHYDRLAASKVATQQHKQPAQNQPKKSQHKHGQQHDQGGDVSE
jgi:ABC-type nickel/cobalt efflux system permease component RcnA